MAFPSAFFRTAAVCSVLSALTTLLLIFLPEFYAPVDDVAGRMARVHDPAYQVRAWAYLLHPFMVLIASLAVAVHVRNRAPAVALIGSLGFILWAFTEAGQQTMTLFAFDPLREAYASADAATRAAILVQTRLLDGLWDGMYFLLLIGFAVGNLCLGGALLECHGLARMVGVLFLAAFLLTVTNMAGALQWPMLPDPLSTWVYAALQPFARLLTGIWLWRVKDSQS